MENYRAIDLSQWTQVGEGGNGKTYVNPDEPDVILKVNNPPANALASVRKEFEASKAVENVGVPTPKTYEIVSVDGAYGFLSERIKGKKSLSRICHDSPGRLDEMAVLLSRFGKELFATPCDTGFFPSRKEQMLGALDTAAFVSRAHKKLLREFVRGIPECVNCVHGDFQPSNVILAGDKPYWIDLGRFAYGDCRFDLGQLFQVCKVFANMKQVHEIFHMTEEQLNRFWDVFATDYTGREDHSDFDQECGRFAALAIILRVIFVKPNFLQNIFFGLIVRRLIKTYFKP